MKNCPLIPMGAMTGKPSREQLRETLSNYLCAGIDQFLIYPRSGMEFEYMGDEWLEACRHVVEFAAENGMSIWLYDEYNWPSGKCAGQVIRENPDFAAKRLDVFTFKDALADAGKAIGLNNGYFFEVYSMPLYADLLSPEAVDCFIRRTHEKYYARFSSYFGSTIKGVFTDEPGAAYAADHHSISGSLLHLPYWKGLEEDYAKAAGRDFRDDLTAHLEGRTPERLWNDYYQLLGARFRLCYFDKLRKWCADRGVLFTGHLMHEHYPPHAIRANGDPMLAIESFGMPGIDEIGTRTSIDDAEWITLKMLETATAMKGVGGLIEVFALGPSDMTISKLRQMLWLAGLHGADHYVMAVSALDARGNIEKPYYYNPMASTQPWFEAFRELGDDARKAAAFATAKADFKIALRYPQSITENKKFKEGYEQPRMLALLQGLVQGQWQVRLVEEDCADLKGYEAVLSLTDDGFKEDLGGSAFKGIRELLVWLETHLVRDAQVVGFDGVPEKDLLVKRYADGTVCVLSLSQHSRAGLSLLRPGQSPLRFDLPGEGVFVSSEIQEPVAIEDIFRMPGGDCEFELLSPNTMRIFFNDDGSACIDALSPLKGVRLALRSYGEPVSVLLDGKPVETVRDCASLPPGFSGLYKESAEFPLSKGRHVLRLSSPVPDFPYLPSAFLMGSFGVFKDGVGALPERVGLASFRSQGLPEYAGTLKFEMEVDPHGAKWLQADTDGLAASACIDGVALGRRAWSPFRWKLPEGWREGMAKLEIEVSTSIGPLFGDYPGRVKDVNPTVKAYWPKAPGGAVE